MTSHQKDLFRIKDETSLPKGKPSCENVLYYELSTQGLATRLVDDGIRITGDLLIFVLYTPEDDERNLEYFETELPFDGIVSCSGCHEDMVADIPLDIKVAVMGCVVNGPGEAREADIGIAGGIGEGLLIKHGEIVQKLPEEELLDALRNELLNWSE